MNFIKFIISLFITTDEEARAMGHVKAKHRNDYNLKQKEK
jgi:hypothetical protein